MKSRGGIPRLSAQRTAYKGKNTMSKVALVSGILCVVLAVIVFVFADGLRRWYSGIFFALLGTLMLINALRWRRAADQPDRSCE